MRDYSHLEACMLGMLRKRLAEAPEEAEYCLYAVLDEYSDHVPSEDLARWCRNFLRKEFRALEQRDSRDTGRQVSKAGKEVPQ